MSDIPSRYDMSDAVTDQDRSQADGWRVLVQDDSCHWYLIPAERRAEWGRFVDVMENGDGDADTPSWATRLGGAPSLIEFYIWRIAKQCHPPTR